MHNIIKNELVSLLNVLEEHLSTGKTGDDGKKTVIIPLEELSDAYQNTLIDFVKAEADASALLPLEGISKFIPIEDSIWKVWVEEDKESDDLKTCGIVAVIDDSDEVYAVINLLDDVIHSLYAK